MRFNINTYKEKYHFATNFYSLFLLFTFIPDFIHVNPGIFKYGFWAIKLLLAAWLIYKSKRIFFNFNSFENIYLALFLIYGANIYINVFLNALPVTSYTTGVMDFVGFCIMLPLALSFRYDKAYESNKSFYFFLVTLTIGLAISYFTAIVNEKLDVSNIRYDANSTVNSINYGQMGCTLSLVSIYGFTNCRKFFLKLLYCIAFLIGLISIAKAGSRSPVVVLVIVGVFFFAARMGTLKGLFLVCIFGAIFLISYQTIISLLESMGSTLAIRLQNAIEENESSGRDEIWQNTLNIINESPYFGKYYLIPSGRGEGAYPHNFFLEAFMTTGILGGIPFVVLVLISISKCYKFIKERHGASWILLLFLQLIVFGNFSTGLYTSQDFWILLFFVLSMGKIAKPEVKLEPQKPERQKPAPVLVEEQ